MFPEASGRVHDGVACAKTLIQVSDIACAANREILRRVSVRVRQTANEQAPHQVPNADIEGDVLIGQLGFSD